MTALSERFINKRRKKTNKINIPGEYYMKTNKSGALDESEIAKAEQLWTTTYLQGHQYSDLIESIEKNNLTI